MGWRARTVSFYYVITLCACRIGYLFFIATPYQAASLSNILSFPTNETPSQYVFLAS